LCVKSANSLRLIEKRYYCQYFQAFMDKETLTIPCDFYEESLPKSTGKHSKKIIAVPKGTNTKPKLKKVMLGTPGCSANRKNIMPKRKMKTPKKNV
jgi:hypothetical protein